MTKWFAVLSFILLGAAALPAQTAARKTPPAVTQVVKPAPAANPAPTGSSQPPILNVLTVIGDNVLGVPCLDCLLGILFPTLGLPQPVGQAFRGSNYQIDT